jgi:hypothetical protein
MAWSGGKQRAGREKTLKSRHRTPGKPSPAPCDSRAIALRLFMKLRCAPYRGDASPPGGRRRRRGTGATTAGRRARLCSDARNAAFSATSCSYSLVLAIPGAIFAMRGAAVVGASPIACA